MTDQTELAARRDIERRLDKLKDAVCALAGIGVWFWLVKPAIEGYLGPFDNFLYTDGTVGETFLVFAAFLVTVLGAGRACEKFWLCKND